MLIPLIVDNCPEFPKNAADVNVGCRFQIETASSKLTAYTVRSVEAKQMVCVT